MITKDKIIEGLKDVIDPEIGISIVDLNMVKDIKIEEDKVELTVALTVPNCPLVDVIKNDVEVKIKSLGAKEVIINLTSMTPEELQQIISTNYEPTHKEEVLEEKESVSKKTPVDFKIKKEKNIKNVIAIASGKGGVGKSTISVNIAVALTHLGKKVGLLDADVHGPSIPTMLGLNERPYVNENNEIVPPFKYGIKIMSLGLLLDETSTPVIWRGPLITSAIEQLYNDVSWGELDYLIIDLPPGTGDASLTVAQSLPLKGVIIVTTPQDVATADASKAMTMFQQLNIKIVGIIENMSYFACPHCGKTTNIFGVGGGEKMAKTSIVPFLGKLPLEVEVRESGDLGKPIVSINENSESSKAFSEVAKKIEEVFKE